MASQINLNCDFQLACNGLKTEKYSGDFLTANNVRMKNCFDMIPSKNDPFCLTSLIFVLQLRSGNRFLASFFEKTVYFVLAV